MTSLKCLLIRCKETRIHSKLIVAFIGSLGVFFSFSYSSGNANSGNNLLNILLTINATKEYISLIIVIIIIIIIYFLFVYEMTEQTSNQ